MSIARWAFDIHQKLLLENIASLVTSLTDEEVSTNNYVPLSNLLNFLPRTEADGLLRHRNENDKRRALVGRLMIYAFFTAHHRCHWGDLVFDCSESTRPVLISPAHLKDVSFNISYYGDWVILVGETELSADSPERLGVDVMDFQEASFRARACGQFTPEEILFIAEALIADTSQGGGGDGGGGITDAKLKKLHRLWCLKESIIRVLDISNGHFNHRSIECTIQGEEKTEKPILSTMIEAQEPKPEQLSGKCWSFEEALLDPEHCYTIAAQTDMEDVTTGSILDGSEVHRFDWKELLKNAVPYTDATR